MRPTILLLPAFDKNTNYCKINQYYFDALLRAGAMPLMLPFTNNQTLLHAYLERTNGILLPGGIDVDPQFYGEKTKDYCGKTDILQDEMSLTAIDYAYKNHIPLFGICRGLQTINVYFNGSLYQDNQRQNTQCFDHQPKIEREAYVHDVHVVKNSQLFDIVGAETIKVNSIHHQAIQRLGESLVAEAHSTDGLIEAIRYEDYIFGVQWHPEALAPKDEKQQALFNYFVSLC